MKCDEKTERRKMLAKRWLEVLTPAQRGAWSIFHAFCPSYDNKAVKDDRTGKEIFIHCNM